MRPLILFLSLLTLLALTACGTEDELIPPNIKVDATTSLLVKDPSATITGTIDDLSATLVANSTVTGEVPVPVDNGSWRFVFAPLTSGANIITFTASDKRGNLNQMILTVIHDPTPPIVTAVVQSVADPVKPQLIVTFDEALLESSLTTALFKVVNPLDESVVLDSLTGTLADSSVTLALAAALPAGSYRLISPAVTDLAGNSLVTNSFDFTIVQ